MKSLIGVLALAVVPTLAAAAEKPDWAFPVTEKVQPPPRFEANRVRPVPPGSALSITRAKADDMYDIPNWFPNMYPPMPAIVQYGNKEKQVRACGSCHLPTGTGHDESAYVAGLPASYFIRQMADWKSGDRKFSPTMVTMVEADVVPKSYIGQGNKRLVHPDGGSEPLGNRIIEVPEDEEVAVYRDPMSGFVAYVPKGSIARGKELASTGDGGKTVPCSICHGRTLQGLGDVPAIAGRHPNYVVRQLWNMQNGDRVGTSAALMQQVVERLSNDDMLAIAAYVASLTP